MFPLSSCLCSSLSPQGRNCTDRRSAGLNRSIVSPCLGVKDPTAGNDPEFSVASRYRPFSLCAGSV